MRSVLGFSENILARYSPKLDFVQHNPFLRWKRTEQPLLSVPRFEIAVTLIFAVVAYLMVYFTSSTLTREVLILFFGGIVFLMIQTRQVLRINEYLLEHMQTMVRKMESDPIRGEEQAISKVRSPVIYRKRFLVKKGQRWFVIPVDDIAWFKIERKLCLLKTWDNQRYVLDQTLDDLMRILDPDLFFRINRSYILNINSIRSINTYFGGKLFLEIRPLPEADQIIVSKEKAMQVKRWLGK